MGSIFCVGGVIFLCEGTLTVRVPSGIYHERMREWIEARTPRPLVFTGDGCRCTMTPQDGGGDVVISLEVADRIEA